MRRLPNILLFILLLTGTLYAQYSPKDTIAINYYQKSGLDTNKINALPKKTNRLKVALVLSGGSSRGVSQIGVLKVFNKYGFEPDIIVGTSIGSIVGSLYSSGYTAPEIDSMFKSINWKKKLSLSNKYSREFLYPDQKIVQDKSLITISLEGIHPIIPTSISTGQKFTEILNSLFLNARYKPSPDFNSLKIPFASVATNLNDGTRTVFQSGNITECVKASFTFPLLYTPTIIDDKSYVDGGLTANIPTTVAKDLGADFVVSVNSTSPLKTSEELKSSVINTADQILSITMAQLNKMQLAASDIVIEPELKNQTAEDFSNIDFLIRRGEFAAEKLMPAIQEKTDSLEALKSDKFNYFLVNPRIKFGNISLPDSVSSLIKSSQENTFIKYTAIEKTLRQIYKLGIYSRVYAVTYRDDNGVILEYDCVKNPVLKDVVLKSPFDFIRNIVNEFYKSNAGKPFNLNNTADLFEKIKTSLRQNQITSADISKFYLDYETGIFEITISEGKLESIIISGNNTTKESFIKDELFFNINHIVKKDEVDNSLKNIFGTNLFSQASISYKNLGNGNIAANIDLVEKSSKNVSLSVRIDNVYNFQLLTDLRAENIFGNGFEAGFTFAGGMKRQDIKGEFKQNKFFGTYLTYNLSAYYNSRDVSDYTEIIDLQKNIFDVNKTAEYRESKYGASFMLGTQIERIGTIYGKISFENLKIRNISNFTSESDNKIFKFLFGGKIDTRDEYPFPASGTFLNYFFETAQNRIRGEKTYSRLYLDIESYFTLSARSNIKPKFLFGFADKTTPLNEQFSFGGENLFYGMQEDELRGNQILIASLLYRYQLPFKIFFPAYMMARYDLGRLWENTEDIRFKDLRHGLGLGIQFDTPIGKASFSAGKCFIIYKGISKDSFVFSPYTFYFSIGYDI